MVNYYSIEAPLIHEIEIKKSRFLTYLIPIESEADFQEELAAIRKEHYKATHHCQAFILGDDSMIQRMSDDGEPAGTAGVPMLEVLKQENLTYVMAVVVRYFGGVKLGSGGLIRAYSNAVSEALKEATIIKNINQMMVNVELRYDQMDSFTYYMSQTELPITLKDTVYTDTVTFNLAINLEAVTEVHDELTNRFSGQLSWTELGEQTVNLPVR
ncbi:YigZ family protein [Aerococcaceae bacterium DSM 109653]|uniref:YigZ family protein n=1 Tax=Fundicoccus ignavus TaxID=2664442 RepID=A0A6I2GMA6_9LACT|nr:YigZ family protein [Fundicoccus ignavus]MRI82124.1 YigZ family protein [Fundicoccus ignavus]MRI85628.1 YigZ family protein [Fundicoccus ignavus]